jgi:hypothetical protein
MQDLYRQLNKQLLDVMLELQLLLLTLSRIHHHLTHLFRLFLKYLMNLKFPMNLFHLMNLKFPMSHLNLKFPMNLFHLKFRLFLMNPYLLKFH